MGRALDIFENWGWQGRNGQEKQVLTVGFAWRGNDWASRGSIFTLSRAPQITYSAKPPKKYDPVTRSQTSLCFFCFFSGPIPLDRGRNFMQIPGPDTSNRGI